MSETSEADKVKQFFKNRWQAFVINSLKAIVIVAQVLPMRLLLRLGAYLGDLAFRYSARYRNVALKNLAIAYGGSMPMAEKLHIVRGVFVNFSKAAVAEFSTLPKMSSQAVKRAVLLRDEDKLTIDNLLARGRGLIVVSAHIGNFEMAAKRFTVEGYKFSVVVRNDNNVAVAETLNQIRSETGYEVLGRGSAAKTILKRLRAGTVVAMLPDQKSDDVFVPFFGRLAGTVAGPAVVGLRTGAPILPIFPVRLADDKHDILLGEVIEPVVTDDKEGDVLRVMTQVNAAIESIVREYPEQWLWLHDRWRVPVPAEAQAEWEAKHSCRTEQISGVS